MQEFYADLHIHSKFSRATSKLLTLKGLEAWAKIKGLTVIGTGDITHPTWQKEIQKNLKLDEQRNLYTFKKQNDLEEVLPTFVGYKNKQNVYFLLQGEISSIYKKADKVRKIHNLVYFSSLQAALKFSGLLEKIGNIQSDGRPILKLDCQDLLDMLLNCDPEGFLIPAHIWTPWFSLFGEKSGFDCLEDCYGSLSSEIFALETGLSSSPTMNWCWSKLDKYALVSNSDAHSGENLGREATCFYGNPSYQGIKLALKQQKNSDCSFNGTLEFFPEQGKYFLDGHRACQFSFNPLKENQKNLLCPICQKSLTGGVSSRIMDLADRTKSQKPDHHPNFKTIIPLSELLAAIYTCKAKSKKVQTAYINLISTVGSELYILLHSQKEEFKEKTEKKQNLKNISELLFLGIHKVRKNDVTLTPGYDGEYGQINIFTQNELLTMKS